MYKRQDKWCLFRVLVGIGMGIMANVLWACGWQKVPVLSKGAHVIADPGGKMVPFSEPIPGPGWIFLFVSMNLEPGQEVGNGCHLAVNLRSAWQRMPPVGDHLTTNS